MKWTYKQDRVLAKVLWTCIHVLHFFCDVSWTYAHYRNGRFPYQFPERPRLFWVNMPHSKIWKDAWRNREMWTEY